MERYALFCARTYYPDGGWRDFKGTFSSVEWAVARADEWEAEEWNWEHTPWKDGGFHVVDLHTGEIVRSGGVVL